MIRPEATDMEIQAEIKEIKKTLTDMGKQINSQITQLMIMVQYIYNHLLPTQENLQRPRKSPEMAAALARISELDKSVLEEFNPMSIESFIGIKDLKMHQQDIEKDNLARTTPSSINNNSMNTTRTSRPKRNFHQFSTSLIPVYKSLLENNLLKPLEPRELPEELPANHNPNTFCTYHQMPGHHTNNCIRLKHKIQDLIEDGTIPLPLKKPNIASTPMVEHKLNAQVNQVSFSSTPNDQSSTTRNFNQAMPANEVKAQTDNSQKPQTTLSQFSEPLSLIYEKLLKAGHVKPLSPTPLPQKLPSYHNPNAFCAFHQMPGHATDECHRLRHKIQDLIDNGSNSAPLAKLNTTSSQ